MTMEEAHAEVRAEREAARARALSLEYGKYGTRHLGEMLALSRAREHQLRTAVESILNQGLSYVEIADIAKNALAVPAPPVVLKEEYDQVVAELNERLMERQVTLMAKGVECEEMRKLLGAAKADAAHDSRMA